MEELRPLVLARASYLCERCQTPAGLLRPDGAPAVLEAHHRLPIGHGGPDTLENLVCLCGPNPAGCHGWVHGAGTASGEAYELGLLLHVWDGAPSEPWGEPPLPRVGW